MSHEKDREHPPEPPPKPAPAPTSKTMPDRKYSEHPSPVPREPIDPRQHPSKRIRARPA